ncbi:hypothetical protein Tco_0791955 [Tanacetum coccineum]
MTFSPSSKILGTLGTSPISTDCGICCTTYINHESICFRHQQLLTWERNWISDKIVCLSQIIWGCSIRRISILVYLLCCDRVTSPKQKTIQATKGTRLKSKAKVAKFVKKKQPPKKPKAKGLTVLSEVMVLTLSQRFLMSCKKSLLGDSEDEDEDDENDSNDLSDEGDNDNDGDDDANDDDKQEGDDKNDDDEETDSDRTESDIIKILVLAGHATTVPKKTSNFTITIPLPPSLFNPLQQEATLTPTPITSETTTSLPTLPDFASVFKFNERVFNLEKDVSEIKQVDQYAQALSSIPAIVDRYMDNKLGDAINKAILTHNLDCKQEDPDEKNAYIELVDISMRALIKEEVNTQIPQILPRAVSDFSNPVIEKNVTESVEAAVLTRSSSQPASTYEAATSLSEFERTKILIDKMEKNKSYDKADYKNKLYDALVESYNTNKDLFDSYGEVFSLKRSRDDSDKDRDPSVGLGRGKKRRKSSKDDESSRDSRSKEKKSSITSKDASQSQHKPFGKSAHARSQVILLKTQACNKIKSTSRETMMNNPLTRRLTKLTGSRNPRDLQLLILIGVRDNKLTFDLLRPGLVKLHVLKNLPLHLMSSMIVHLISLHLS